MPSRSRPATGLHVLSECPPNGQGVAALLIARHPGRLRLGDPALSEADRIHLLAEATKAAYRQRDALIADPAAMTARCRGAAVRRLIAALRRHLAATRPRSLQGWDLPDHRDTVYVSVVDRDGNAVSLINSLFFAFGSGIYAPNAGVLLQNRGAGFRIEAGIPTPSRRASGRSTRSFPGC